MARIRGWRWVWSATVLCGMTATASSAQVTFTTLVNFDGFNGSSPDTNVLIQGPDGNFYGTTDEGGATYSNGVGNGSIFKVTPQGTLTTLYSFCLQSGCPDGSNPLGSLLQTASGDLYGVTESAGKGRFCGYPQTCGTIFKFSPSGELQTLYNFCSEASCVDGEEPFAGLVQGSNGDFYGTTFAGGIHGAGTIFEMTPAGRLTILYLFCAQSDSCPDGAGPRSPLVRSAGGNFYGETMGGGIAWGTIFELTPTGKLTTLFSFGKSNGEQPIGGLLQAANGALYGVTSGGGSAGSGTVFKITTTGKLTTLYNFCSLPNCADGAFPNGPLVQGSDGNFYGTTYGGEVSNGTVFEITADGKLSTLYTFCAVADCADGYFPLAGMFQATSGTFYGTTWGGGTGNNGTIFSLSTGLAPFVKTQPTSAKDGAAIGIFGQGFTRSSVVQFGGVQATSVKLSGSTFLTARVPAGALTGPVTVTSGATTLTSNQTFRVTPQVLSFNPPSGSVGTQVMITGTGFTQTNGVGFGDSIPAGFTVNSDTQVTATVPAGAKTGPVGVVTKGGTAISTATFTVN